MTISELLEKEKESLVLEYELKIKRIRDELDDGVGDMKWLKVKIGIQSADVIKEIILYPFRRELEGRIAYYPEGKGKPWRFNKQPMIRWLEENFERIGW